MTRGYRNNNPGNIRKTKSLWKGEIEGKDKDFKTFKDMPHGYRALLALLKEYIKNGYDTIEKIISRYAPSNENNTNAYISTVTKKTGFSKDDKLKGDDHKALKKLAKAISFVENGVEANETDIDKGFNLLA